MNCTKIISHLHTISGYKRFGKVVKVIGLLIESEGPHCILGEICWIHISNGLKKIQAEVIGFKENHLVLMPYDEIQEISPGCLVEPTGETLQVKVGYELMGKVIDPLGNPLNGESLPYVMKKVNVDQSPPNPLNRPPIDEVLELGVKPIDTLLTVGKGQRVGIFAGSGVGKSTLLGMLSRNAHSDINVIALIGERGREVREFIERDLGSEGMKRSIIIAATSDQSSLMRIKGAFTATRIAEYFRDQGLNVLFMMDSVTRIAMAQREIGLAIGEPPATKGYTPSVFAILPKLLERTGTNESGSITGLYTVLVDGDDLNDPIADTVRGILDGHFVLSRELANQGHYPALDTLKSVSRLMNHLSSREHQSLANKTREILSIYKNAEDLINIGAYKAGASKEIDEAIALYPVIMKFFKQHTTENIPLEESVATLKEIIPIGNEI